MGFTKMTGDVIRAMRECPVPIIAGIHGIAAGAGCGDRAGVRLPGRQPGPGRFAFLFTKVGPLRRRHGRGVPAAARRRRSAGPPSC